MSRAPITLTTLESERLLQELLRKDLSTKQRHKSFRNYTAALIMLDAGLRVGECVQLRWGDLFYNCQPVTSIIVRVDIAKNRVERQIPVCQRLSQALKDFCLYVNLAVLQKENSYVFQATGASEYMSTRQIERIIKEASLNSIGRPIHPHVLRHTFATKLIKVTNIRVVQQLLGHKSIQTTQIYTHPDQEDLTDAINTMNGGSEKNGNH